MGLSVGLKVAVTLILTVLYEIGIVRVRCVGMANVCLLEDAEITVIPQNLVTSVTTAPVTHVTPKLIVVR